MLKKAQKQEEQSNMSKLFFFKDLKLDVLYLAIGTTLMYACEIPLF